MSGPAVVWFRQDLRLADQPALLAALRQGGPVLPVFVWHPPDEHPWPVGAAARWWLHQSLSELDRQLHGVGSRLIIRQGPAREQLRAIVEETGATAIFWNRRYEPAAIQRDADLKAYFRATGLTVESFNSHLLFEPWTVQTLQGKPYQIYTPFWKACSALPPPAVPQAAPSRLPPPPAWPSSVPLAQLGLEPRLDWAAGMREAWRPGAEGAAALWRNFLRLAISRYGDERNRPDLPGTSRLSPHLHWGEISPRQIWADLHEVLANRPPAALRKMIEVFQKEVVWREFAYHLLYHFPKTDREPLRTSFRYFPWRDDPAALRAWQRGRTGYPMVDAGMRELWATGWMHNRVRMIVASFLVKHLLLPWQSGAAWFWDTLVDADLANNSLGWQWTAGCGADAAPYFRVFNPVLQGQKFDPKGDYVRRWVPELAHLPADVIHQPWKGGQVVPGYPPSIVEHTQARARALAALATTTGGVESL